MPKCKKKHKGLNAVKNTKVVSSPYFNGTKSTIKRSLVCQSGENRLCFNSLINLKKVKEDFYQQKCLHLAKAMLGKIIVHQMNGHRLSGLVTETECYLGNEDVASHSFNGKRTPRNEPMFMKPGTSYVYSIYGMYHCFNISSKEDGSCVLIRALEPLESLEQMEINRQQHRKPGSPQLKGTQLCNGPSKLCQALNITKETCNKISLIDSESFWVEEGVGVKTEAIVTSKRIGIDSAGEEWANKPLRFYVINNDYVSRRDKKAEEELRRFCENR